MSIDARGVTPLLEVFDMYRSIAFYCDVLGFELIDKYEPEGHLYWAMLKLGGATIMLNARYKNDKRPPAPDAGRAAGHADTELYFGCGDVEAAYTDLMSKGLQIAKPKITHYRMKQLWLADPDGFKLCFQQPAGGYNG